MTAASLSLSELSAGYGKTRVIEDLSLAVPEGARLGIFGRNGVGKTTLLATIVGLTRLVGGRIRIGESDLTGLSTAARARAGVGYVPQSRDVFPSLTVEENLFVGLKGRPRGCVEEAYRLFPRLAERRRNLAWQLSGGEQQMLSTARAILGQPRVLLLDEPLEGLAPVICDELMASFRTLAESGSMTVILVEQQIERALDFAEQVIVLDRGRIVWSGDSAALRAAPEVVERYIGVAHVHAGESAAH